MIRKSTRHPLPFFLPWQRLVLRNQRWRQHAGLAGLRHVIVCIGKISLPACIFGREVKSRCQIPADRPSPRCDVWSLNPEALFKKHQNRRVVEHFRIHTSALAPRGNEDGRYTRSKTYRNAMIALTGDRHRTVSLVSFKCRNRRRNMIEKAVIFIIVQDKNCFRPYIWMADKHIHQA